MKSGFFDYVQNKEETLKSIRKPIMGWICTYIPEEIIIAADFHPYRILPHTDPSLANSYLDSNFCPFVRSCLGEAINKKLPHIKNLIMANSCDAMRRLYDAWKDYFPDSFVYFLDLPRTNSKKAIQYYYQNLQLLITEVEKHFKVKITQESLYHAILVCNNTRKLLEELFNLYKDNQIFLPALDLSLIIESSMIFPKEEFNKFLAEFMQKIKKEKNFSSGIKKLGNEFRILISGTIMDDSNIFEVIEYYGGKVVFIDMCTGSRYYQNQIQIQKQKKLNIDPLKLVAEHYLNKIPCPRMMDLEKRWVNLLEIIKNYQIDGVIFYNLKFCDTSMFELPLIKKRLQKYRIPSLCLEGDYTPATSGRIKTRIQAFMEVLEFAG